MVATTINATPATSTPIVPDVLNGGWAVTHQPKAMKTATTMPSWTCALFTLAPS
jgi:hypothetical protein